MSGTYCGYGIKRYSDGSVYHGQWFEGRYHGNGHLSYRDGSIYEGVFCKGLREGYGVYRQSGIGGVIKSGLWQHDVLESTHTTTEFSPDVRRARTAIKTGETEISSDKQKLKQDPLISEQIISEQLISDSMDYIPARNLDNTFLLTQESYPEWTERTPRCPGWLWFFEPVIDALCGAQSDTAYSNCNNNCCSTRRIVEEEPIWEGQVEPTSSCCCSSEYTLLALY